jgi:hypothetical protein
VNTLKKTADWADSQDCSLEPPLTQRPRLPAVP